MLRIPRSRPSRCRGNWGRAEVATVKRLSWKFGWAMVSQRRCKFGHSLDLHVSVLELPFIIFLQQYGAD